MKKIALIALALILVFNVVAFADEAVADAPEYGVVAPTTKAPEERLVPGELNITVNGKVLYFVYKTYAENGVSFAHGEKFLNELGYSTNFDKTSATLTASKDNTELVFKVGENGARLAENTLFVPVRATAENLGYTVNWNADKYLVEIVGDQND